jgi:hypothetical protein
MDVLIAAKAPLQPRNVYGGTVLVSTVYGAVQSAAPSEYVKTFERLIAADVDLAAVNYVTGSHIHRGSTASRLGARSLRMNTQAIVRPDIKRVSPRPISVNPLAL